MGETTPLDPFHCGQVRQETLKIPADFRLPRSAVTHHPTAIRFSGIEQMPSFKLCIFQSHNRFIISHWFHNYSRSGWDNYLLARKIITARGHGRP